MVPKLSGTIRRYDFVGVGVVLLDKMCHCGGGLLGIIWAQAMPSEIIPFLLPSDQDVKALNSSTVPTMSVCRLPYFLP